jgi:NAD(P)-dependent dehydrogenase (short-subunit alcohol dehydrogenase family)
MSGADKGSTGPRVALVTGGNRGIGLEVCRQLAAAGCRVVLSARDARKARSAVQQLSAPGLVIQDVPLDVTDRGSVARARREIEARLGPVDVLVNNAAILEADGDAVLDIVPAIFRSTFETNVFAVADVCREFVPGMVERGYGRVVNVSSGAGQLSAMGTYAPVYSMSKAALNAFTKILANTVQGSGVLVNAVDPGWVRTDMGGPQAPRSPAQGAETIVWLATLPASGPSGGFFRDKRPIAW